MHQRDSETYEGPPCEMCRISMFIGTCTHRPRKMPKFPPMPVLTPEQQAKVDRLVEGLTSSSVPQGPCAHLEPPADTLDETSAEFRGRVERLEQRHYCPECRRKIFAEFYRRHREERDRRAFDAHVLLKQGGDWLGRARAWMQSHKHNGSTVRWQSDEVLQPPLTVREVEEVAAFSAAAALNENGVVRVLQDLLGLLDEGVLLRARDKDLSGEQMFRLAQVLRQAEKQAGLVRS